MSTIEQSLPGNCLDALRDAVRRLPEPYLADIVKPLSLVGTRVYAEYLNGRIPERKATRALINLRIAAEALHSECEI